MSVLDKATNQLADVLAAEVALMGNLNKVRGHKAKLIEFIDMYRRFDASGEPQPTEAGQTEAREEPSTAEVTPAAVENVTAEETPSSSAPIQSSTAARMDVHPDGGVSAREHESRGPTPEEQQAGTQAPPVEANSPEGASEEVGGVASACSASAAGSEIPERRELDVDADATGVTAGETAPTPPSQVDSGAADGVPADAQSSEVATREDAASAAPETLTWKARVAETHAAHPDWTAAMIAAELGITAKHVRDAAGDAGVTLAAARRGPTTDLPPLKDRVLAVLAEHPDWPARKIADHLGAPQSDVSQLRYPPHSLPIRKLTAEELTEARKSGGRTGGLAKSGKAVETPPAPTPPPEPERPPAASVPAPRAVNDDEIIPPEPARIKRPKGTQFRLRDRETGLYLHQDLAQSVNELRLTPLRAYPWTGNADQLLAVRKKYPAARDLSEVVVEKEQARV